MVILLWEKRRYPDGSSSWQIKEKVWRFSTAFCTVNEWKFADIVSMADHLKKCSYNAVERREEAVPLPCRRNRSCQSGRTQTVQPTSSF
ncbi:hypothetical protein Y1Q_0022026 [Alligator mississippiensis]|nr:hypothetical protein Y1Q_0022026 [Alligator mississippiensis]